MRDNKNGVEDLQIQLSDTKAKFGRQLTNKEFEDFKNSRQISLATIKQNNQKL